MEQRQETALVTAIAGLTQAVMALAHTNETNLILRRIEQKVNNMAATLDQVLQDVTDESNVIDGISTLIQGLKQQLADALSGANLPPQVQQKVDAIFAQAETNKAKLATAVTANTPEGTPGS